MGSWDLRLRLCVLNNDELKRELLEEAIVLGL